MARYTTKRTTVAEANNVPDAVNYEGAPAFKYTPELELALRCTSNFMENDFYASRNEIAQAIKDLAVNIGQKDPEYVMKLAAWLRNDMNMRSVSVYLLATMAGHPDFRGKTKPWLMKYGPAIMSRADEPAEALAAFKAIYPNEKIPQALLKAISTRLNRLSAYEAIKYRGKTRDWALSDVIRIVHPKPETPAQGYLFNWIVKEEADVEGAKKVGLDQLVSYLKINKADSFDKVDLESLDGATWELLTSKFGSTPQVWETAAKVMPPFAYIRNLRNILNKSNATIDEKKIVAAGNGHKILPFRFLTARKVIDGLGKEFSTQAKTAKKALDEAIERSVANVPNLGKIAILVDYSGSMGATVSGKSDMTRSDVARIFAAAAFKKADNAVIIEYESNARVVKGIDQNDRLFSIVDKLHGPAGGTSLAAALEQVKPYLQDIDMIYILTDEQSWIPSQHGRSSFYGDHAHTVIADLMKQKKCLRVVNHNLASLGTSDLPFDTRILDLGGWSDQVFNVIDSWKNGGMIEYIKNWKLDTEVIED